MDWQEYARKGLKIHAIKAFRRTHGVGLAEAHYAVEGYLQARKPHLCMTETASRLQGTVNLYELNEAEGDILLQAAEILTIRAKEGKDNGEI